MTTPHYADGAVTLWHGDCLDVLQELSDASVDAVVTDPPYGLGFMGHEWDQPGEFGALRRAGIREPMHRRDREARRETKSLGPGRDKAGQVGSYDLSLDGNALFGQWCQAWATECLRVLKPGGHLLAFGGSRTWHRLAAGVEDAGFEIRDSIAWLYGSGFPKSRNLDGDWQGWGTALKPAFEPVVVARKPFAGTVAANVHEHGTGALNIDGCRIPTTDALSGSGGAPLKFGGANARPFHETAEARGANPHDGGRWPANVILDESQAAALDEQSGVLTSGANPTRRGSDKFRDAYGEFAGQEDCTPARGATSGGASRFFYVAKAAAAERPRHGDTAHPTVKPLALMRHLVRLVTPPEGLVLDPFAGSGTTLEAAIIEGFRAIGVEREANYLPLIVERLSNPIQQVLA